MAVGVLWTAGDRWWAATLLTFGPRWVVLLPIASIALLALFCCRRALAPLAAAAILGAVGYMGFSIPWRQAAAGAPRAGAPVVRVVTYNCGSGGDVGELGRFADFVKSTAPDIIILNEWTTNTAHARPVPEKFGDGWHTAHNASIILSRFPIVSEKKLGADRLRKKWRAPAIRCEVETPWGVVHVVGVHLDTPREGLSDVEWKKFWRAAGAIEEAIEDRRLESECASELATDAKGPTIIAGDFNMPVDSAIYRRYWSAWQNAFSTAGFGFGYTKHTRHWGIRIDHVLASRDWRILDARVGPDLGGDHRPVVVTLELSVAGH
jgi:endonuclease/exonuclease/phosphatase (EEP) superfamily protein YafD